MIYTLTVNPSLDYITDVKDFETGKVNRTSNETIFPGGKGINVSIVLHNLSIENKALGFTAGFTGKAIEEMLLKQNVNTDFIHLEKGLSRINLKLRSNEESEINGKGPDIKNEDIEKLYVKLDEIKENDTLVLAGSIPSCLSESFYSEIMKRLSGKNIRFVVDATKDLLKKSLEFRPFLVKPNNHELGEIFGVELKSREDVIPYALKMKEMGAQNVLVSMAGEGAVLASADGKVYKGKAPKGKLVNSVGAGDSMVAGFIAGYEKTHDYKQALKMGLCTGTASACSEFLATQADVDKLLNSYDGFED
ncbi:MAG: 1-phosphofructokinase [Treponema sp.]|nr:1-phosphofructokinase [Treponema sp.]